MYICAKSSLSIPALVILHTTDMNTGMHVSSVIIVFFGCMPRSGIAGSMIVLCF